MGEYQKLRESHQVRNKEFIAAVVQFGYVHQQLPFMLRRATRKELDLLRPIQWLANLGPAPGA